MSAKTKLLLGVLALSLPAAVIVAIMGRGSFGHVVGLFSLCFHAGLPALATACLLLLIARLRQSNPLRWLATVAFAVSLALAVQLLSIPLGSYLNRKDLLEAEAYCNSLIPAIQAAKTRTGSYPPNLEGLLSARPQLVNPEDLYNSTGDSFSLYISDPASLFGGFRYESNTGSWKNTLE